MGGMLTWLCLVVPDGARFTFMKPYRFSKEMRLRKQREFEAVYEEGVRIRGGTLLVVARKNGLEHPRLGISVSKKKMKRAADRNRFKRLVRESFRLKREKLPVGLDLIVIPHRGDSPFTLLSIQDELIDLGAQAQKRLGKKP